MKYLYYLLFIIPLLASTCKEEDNALPVEEIPDCTHDYTQPAINNDTVYTLNCMTTVEFQYWNLYDEYKNPIFNPNNPNEFVFTRVDYENSIGCAQELCTFNFCTGKLNIIASNNCGYPDWSIKDWIIYKGSNQQLYKIKSNGDSLTQLTNSGNYNSNPRWDEYGTKFMYRKELNGNWFLIADEKGNTLDTLDTNIFGGTSYYWRDGLITFATGGNPAEIWTYDYNTKETNIIDTLHGYHSIPYPRYVKSLNSVVWNTLHNFYYTNIETKERKQFLSSYASNRYYTTIDVSPDEKNVILTRINREKIDECTVEGEVVLYMIDTDGANERRIQIPE